MKDHTQFADALALYAAGALDDAQELQELRAHLGSCGVCRSELESLRGDMALFALSATGPQPPQRSRQRLMAAVAAEPRLAIKPRPRFVLGRLRSRWLTFAPIAVMLALAVSGLLLWREDAQKNRELRRIRQELAQTNQQLLQAKAVADLLHAPDMMQVILVSSHAPPPPHISTMYSAQKGTLLLMASNLEPLPANKVYELWLLPMHGGAPMPAGTFKPDASGKGMMFHEMASIGIEARTFALTIEPEGGSQSPTAPIKMMGAG